MSRYLFYADENAPAIHCAVEQLKRMGFDFAKEPCMDVTHLLMPVPTKDQEHLMNILQKLSPDVRIIGGNLPELPGYRTYDLLKDAAYVAENAYITAHCAVRLILDRLPVALRGCKILVIGWGRIGKCLAALLKGLEAQVTVAARKEYDRAMLAALGYGTSDTVHIDTQGYRVIINTAPTMLLPEIPYPCLKIDLASVPGLGGDDVIHARGLPGKDAPEASGNLITRRILYIINKECAL